MTTVYQRITKHVGQQHTRDLTTVLECTEHVNKVAVNEVFA